MTIAEKWLEYEVDIKPDPLTGVVQAAFYGGATAVLLILDKAEDPEATLQQLLAEARSYAGAPEPKAGTT